MTRNDENLGFVFSPNHLFVLVKFGWQYAYPLLDKKSLSTNAWKIVPRRSKMDARRSKRDCHARFIRNGFQESERRLKNAPALTVTTAAKPKSSGLQKTDFRFSSWRCKYTKGKLRSLAQTVWTFGSLLNSLSLDLMLELIFSWPSLFPTPNPPK